VENLAHKEDCGAFLPRWLRVEEIVALQLHAPRVECVGHVFLPVLIGITYHSLAVLHDKTKVGVATSNY
jgi:hypothetical protein